MGIHVTPFWSFNTCKMSEVEVWGEEAGPSAIQGAMTDRLTVVNCKPLLSEGVDAVPDQSLHMGRVSSNGSIAGLVGKISADPITSRKSALADKCQFVNYRLC